MNLKSRSVATTSALLWMVIAGTLATSRLAVAQEVDSSMKMSARVDELLGKQMAEMGWNAADSCSDEVFLRRASLDLTGSPPTASEVLKFVADKSENKRRALIDSLLVSPRSATHLGATWAGWMLPEQDNAPFFGDAQNGLEVWLRDRFSDNLRYDRLVSDLLVASGPAQSGPAAFFISLEGKPEKIAAKTARVFLGVQLDCAECHDHPFDDWSQQDFWGFAAYFAQLSTNQEMAMTGRGELGDTDEGEVTLPDTDEVIAPKPLVDTGYSGIGTGTRRQQLTLWLTAKENPFLARATVNRVWALLFGQGLIEPIDDMRSIDMASHPEVLRELSEYFADSGYDLRNLIQTLANTQAYQRSTTHERGQPPELSYASMKTKPLTELQLANTLSAVARQISGNNQNAQRALQNQLGKLRGDASQAKLGIVSALVTLHGGTFDAVANEESSRLLKALDAPYMDANKQLRWMFLSTLNREPTEKENAAFSEMLSLAAGPADASPSEDESASGEEAAEAAVSWQSDLLWALVNSTEFAMTP